MLAYVTSFLHSDEAGLPSPTRNLKLDEIEETERQWRMCRPQYELDLFRTSRTASLIQSARFPVPVAGAGFKRFTLSVEERERTRRLDSKSESLLRKKNANRTARMIIAIGWPFIHNSCTPAFIFVSPIQLLEEEERRSRLSNPEFLITARNNAAMVSLVVKVAFQSGNFPLCTDSKSYTRLLEEKERALRLQDAKGLDYASFKSHLVARLIKQLGWPFFVTTVVVEKPGVMESAYAAVADAMDTAKPILKESVHSVKPAVQAAVIETSRLASKALGYASKSASDTAHQIKSTVAVTAHSISEATQDTAHAFAKAATESVHTAGKGANNVAHTIAIATSNAASSVTAALTIGSKASLTTVGAAAVVDVPLEEEMERVRRILDVEEEKTARAHALFVSQMLHPKIVVLEESERRRRLTKTVADQDRMNANRVAWMVEGLLMTKRTSQYIEEQERQRRIRDTASAEMARANAKKVAYILSESPLLLAQRVGTLENAEQIRRMHDRTSQVIAKKNARKVSRMIEKRFDRSQRANYTTISQPTPIAIQTFPAPIPSSFSITPLEMPLHAIRIPAPAQVPEDLLIAKIETVPIPSAHYAPIKQIIVPNPTSASLSKVSPATSKAVFVSEEMPKLPETHIDIPATETITTVTTKITETCVIAPQPVSVQVVPVATSTVYEPIVYAPVESDPNAHQRGGLRTKLHQFKEHMHLHKDKSGPAQM